jgi:hypothetical protein
MQFDIYLCVFAFIIFLCMLKSPLLQYLMPFVEKEKYELPRKCRLRADNDMFREQEQHKIYYDVKWRCGFCKKAFRAEKFLDQHLDNRHKDLVDNVCLLHSCYTCF